MPGAAGLIPLIQKLSVYLPHALAGVVALIVGILAYLFVVVRAARKRQALAAGMAQAARPPGPEAEEEAQPEEEVPQPAGEADEGTGGPRAQPAELKRSFADAVKTLKLHVSGKGYRYQIPWFLAIGEADSGKATLLDNTGLNLPLGRPYEDPTAPSGCNWWFFDNGIVLDIAGDYVLQSDGKPADDRGWRSLLKLLRKHRPQRPIDGVVLTIPCTDLVGPESQLEERLAGAREKAVLLYKRLWEAQKRLGMRFPIYVLITKCDQVAGFSEFCGELPERVRHDMFGWSSPYTLGAAFSPDWVDEAFQRLFDTLYQTQIEIFASANEVREGDRLFLFPAEFSSMAEPLRVYLNQIFKQSVYHDSFILRGIYFSGDADAGPPSPLVVPGEVEDEAEAAVETTPAPALHSAASRRKKPCFLRDLFERKIFPESGLARPAARTYVSRNRTMLAVQGLLALSLFAGGLGLWNAHGSLRDEQRSFLPLVQQIARDLPDLKDKDKISQGFFSGLALDLFKGMSGIRSSELSSIFIPSSWFTAVHTEIVDALGIAYDKIIMASLLGELRNRAEQIVQREYDRPSAPAGGRAESIEDIPESIEETREFVDLRRFVTDLDELDRNIRLYNGLQGEGFADLDDLGEVVRYLFHIELPQAFYTHSEYYRKALAKTSSGTLEVGIYGEAAVARAREQFRRFYGRAFNGNFVVAHVREIAHELDGSEYQKRHGRDLDIGAFQDMLKTVSRLEAALANPQLAWIAGETLDLGPAFDAILAAVDRSAFLGSGLREEFEADGQAGFREFKERLGAYGTKYAGPILAQEGGQVAMALSPGMLEVKASLENFLNQKFIALEPDRQFIAELPPGTRLLWDTRQLEEAGKLVEPYEQFIHNGLLMFPVGWQPMIKGASLRRLEVNMVDLVARAQVVESAPEGFARLYMEEETRAETRNFKAAVKPLGAMLSTFDRLGFADAYNSLFQLVVAQASRMLVDIDALLEEEGLYEFDDLSVWKGRKPLTSVLFSARDADAVTYYLDVQRERVKYLAFEYAEPLVTFLENPRMSRGQVYLPLVTKWRRILSELRKYEAKKPGGSVTVLENFFFTDLNTITLDTLFERTFPAQTGARSGDFFLQKRDGLLARLYERGLELAEEDVIAGYGAMAALFNQRLSGRYPFSTVADEGPGPEADPDAVRDFFELFGQHATIGRAVLKRSPGFRHSGSDALAFLEQMEKVRQFFAPFLEASSGPGRARAPIFDLGVDFRVNREYEVGGNQVIDWEMRVGDRRMRRSDSEHSARWRFGDPIQFSLRWAKNSPYIPLADSLRSRVDAENRTITYEYTNRWSLLRFLEGHAGSPEDFEQFVDTSPHTLKFVVDIQKGSDGRRKDAPQPERLRTKIFVRFRLMSPDKKEELVLPSFPTQAPALNSPRPVGSS